MCSVIRNLTNIIIISKIIIIQRKKRARILERVKKLIISFGLATVNI